MVEEIGGIGRDEEVRVDEASEGMGEDDILFNEEELWLWGY